jgi:SAM-dependent methyltransferase
MDNAIGMKQLVARGYDAIADRYLERYGASAVRALKLAELCAGLPAGARVLDLGCGAGLPTAQQVVARGFTVTGIDFSAAQIERARRNVPEGQFFVADMTGVELPRDTFDAVAAFYSITHVPRDEHGRLLGRIAGWLKPGGRLIASFGATPVDGCQNDWLGTTMFFSHHDADTTRQLVHAAGLGIEHAEVVRQDNEDADFLWITARKP